MILDSIRAPRSRARLSSWIVVAGAILAAIAVPSVRAAAPVTGPLVRFTVFGLRSSGDVAFVPKPGAAPQKIRFYPTARSPRYEYRGASPLRFIDPETKAVVAEAVVPPGAGEVLLVFSPAVAGGKGAGAPRYDVTVLEDSFTRHPAGSLVMLNLSGVALSGTVNDRAVSPEPGPTAPLSVGRSAVVRLLATVKGRVVQSYAGTTALGRDERALLVLFPPFHPGSAEVQARLLVDKPGGASPPPARRKG